MKLFLGDIEFDLISFQEVINRRKEAEDAEIKTIMEVHATLAYDQSLETILPELEEYDFASLTIQDGDKQRIYAGYEFSGLEQNIANFNQVNTVLHLAKKDETVVE